MPVCPYTCSERTQGFTCLLFDSCNRDLKNFLQKTPSEASQINSFHLKIIASMINKVLPYCTLSKL